ncbi:MAG: signal peptidase I [Patescibacteria group bacterium]
MEPAEEKMWKKEAPPEERKPSAKESILDFAKFAIIAVAVVTPIRLFIAQPFIVSGASMVPAFETGHYLIIDELSYRFENPKRGDVIVFRFPPVPSKFLIKRVAGLPGETIEVKGDTVTVKNAEHPDGFVWRQGSITEAKNQGDVTVKLNKDEYYVLGDNRGESADSRLWGTLSRELIVGRPLIRLYPLSKIGVFPGEWKTE